MLSEPIQPLPPTKTPTMRDFIGKKATIPSNQNDVHADREENPPLLSSLPKEPQELTHEELLDSYYKLALRCFQSESSLDMAKELIKNLERNILNQRVWITKLEEERDKSVDVLRALKIGTK